MSLFMSVVTFLNPVQHIGITTEVSSAASIGVMIPLPDIISAIAVTERVTSIDKRMKMHRLIFLCSCRASFIISTTEAKLSSRTISPLASYTQPVVFSSDVMPRSA